MNLQRRWGGETDLAWRGGGEGGGRDSTKQSRCSGAGWRSSHHFVPPPLVPGSQHCTVLLLFSLASEKLEDDDKTRIAVRLVSAKTKGDTFGTANLSQLTEKTELRDLVTSNSWELFILKMSADWLALPPTKWDTSLDYIRFRDFVRTWTVKVINDCAERGVKLATDYSKSLTKDSQERSKIYQVVEAEWISKPDTKKRTMNKWFFMCLCIDFNDLLI